MSIPYRVPGYPWTPLLFVLAAAAIVGNAVIQALLDPSQFKNLVIAIALFLIGLPAYFFWRKRSAATCNPREVPMIGCERVTYACNSKPPMRRPPSQLQSRCALCRPISLCCMAGADRIL